MTAPSSWLHSRTEYGTSQGLFVYLPFYRFRHRGRRRLRIKWLPDLFLTFYLKNKCRKNPTQTFPTAAQRGQDSVEDTREPEKGPRPGSLTTSSSLNTDMSELWLPGPRTVESTAITGFLRGFAPHSLGICSLFSPSVLCLGAKPFRVWHQPLPSQSSYLLPGSEVPTGCQAPGPPWSRSPWCVERADEGGGHPRSQSTSQSFPLQVLGPQR